MKIELLKMIWCLDYCCGMSFELTFIIITTTGGGEVLSSSSLVLFGSSFLKWTHLCPSKVFKPTVSLCWQHTRNHSQCVSVQNSTMHMKDLVSAQNICCVNVGCYGQGFIFPHILAEILFYFFLFWSYFYVGL